MEIARQIQKHMKQSVHYLHNAQHYIESKDAEKASEFLWGALTQALKSVALTKEITLKSHNQIREYALEFRKSGDPEIYQAFSIAQSLHSNFYETGLSIEEVAIGAEQIKKAITTLLAKLPQERKG